MSLGGFNCPYCRNYNANDDKVCTRCGRYLPPRWVASALKSSPLGPYPATIVLIALCALVFFAQLVDARNVPTFSIGLRGIPMSTLLRFGALTNDVKDTPWTVVSYMFAHMGLLHIIMNMLALWELGRRCETETGAGITLFTYLITGAAGGIASVWWYGEAPYITAGASGAIFGLSGFLLGVLIRAKDPQWKDVLIRTLIFSFIMYFALGTNQAAHMGGLVIGIALGLSKKLAKNGRNAPIAWAIIAGLTLIASLATLIPSQFDTRWSEVRASEQGKTSNTLFNYPTPQINDFEFIDIPTGNALDVCSNRSDAVSTVHNVLWNETPQHRALFWAQLANVAGFRDPFHGDLLHKPTNTVLRIDISGTQTRYLCGVRYDPNSKLFTASETAEQKRVREQLEDPLKEKLEKSNDSSRDQQTKAWQALVENQHPPGVWQAIYSLEILAETLPSKDLRYHYFDAKESQVLCEGADKGVSFSVPCPFAEGFQYLVTNDASRNIDGLLRYVLQHSEGKLSAEQAAQIKSRIESTNEVHDEETTELIAKVRAFLP